jgi:ATP-dependent Lon protease
MDRIHFFLNKHLLGNPESSNDGEYIQIVNESGDNSPKKEDIPDELSLLPVKNTVLFPGVVIPITVGRKKSIRLVKKAYESKRIIGVIAQSNSKAEEPALKDLYKVGTVAKIIKMLVLPDGSITIIIQGSHRFEIKSIIQEEPYYTVSIKILEDKFLAGGQKETNALVQSIKDSASKILRLNPEIPQEAQIALDNIHDPGFLTHFLSSNLNVDVSDKQKLLEAENGQKRATLLLQYMLKEVKLLELKQEIQKKVNTDIDQQQRDYYLRQQIKVLQDELGYDGPDRDLADLRDKGAKKLWPEYVARHFTKELEKIQRMNPAAAEYPVAMNYAEFLIDLPWGEVTKDNFDLNRAKEILDADHFGLEKVKDRILEYLAVLKLKQDMKGPILCLYGPPGVGKTSLGKSIAHALNRHYVRVSLGGLHDEAEIRGHRKTYVGAMPGKIIQNIKKAKTSNPVFILDEIDKVNSDFRGDPASALLEVLDPEQNHSFQDNYLELEYDLSKVLFVATANSLETIHPALRDRMEVIEINGYTLEEKIEIAKRHLIPKQRNEHGLKTKQVNFHKNALVKLIDGYTRESGVRNLERQIGTVIRKIARAVAMKKKYNTTITDKRIIELIGPEIFDKEFYQENKIPGVATGLAWTPTGGEILFIESSLSKGKGKLTLSGHLGEVMKESAMAALSFLKSYHESLGIDYRAFDKYDLHIHVPAGAVPKDGPSAGITILCSLASVFTQRTIRPKVAMTGEITLRGTVLPVGGIKEKILAAKRAGIKEIILCHRNKKDIEEIESSYIRDLKIYYVSTVAEVLNKALQGKKVKGALEFELDLKAD